jgi:hypothetical protein
VFRSYSGIVDKNGNATLVIEQFNAAMEWDIYQISCVCGSMGNTCIVVISVNGAFLCSSPQGSGDTATGPPDTVLGASDTMTIQWTQGTPGDQVIANLWYNENVDGTTFSSAH